MIAQRTQPQKGGTTHVENDPMQPIERRHRRLTPEQEAHAQQEIEHAIDDLSEDEPLISNDTARLIAAAVHAGDGSILEHFAATNRLNPKLALREVNEAIHQHDHPTWGFVLALYLESIESPLPDARTPEFREPAPEVFLRSGETGRAGWVPLGGPPAFFEKTLQAFDPDWSAEGDVTRRLDRDDWEIGNVVGFHGVDVSGAPNLRRLLQLAQGINKYGEGFAAYLALFGIDGASRYTYQRLHLGAFDNLTTMVAAFAFSQGILDADNTPGEDRTRGPTVNIRLLERGLSEHYLWHSGRTSLHLFARDTRGYKSRSETSSNE
jgi:hypothetical protein